MLVPTTLRPAVAAAAILLAADTENAGTNNAGPEVDGSNEAVSQNVCYRFA